MKTRPYPATIGLTIIGLMFLPQVILAGSISGEVIDSGTNATLPSATITVVETGRMTTAGRDGRFTISNLPAGTCTLRADYVGYPSDSQTVNVSETGDSHVGFSLGGEVLLLDTLIVEGEREGRARALQQKRTAQNLMEIVSTDSAGNLPDRNVADALARVPGLSIIVDAGEGQFVSIRGIEPNLNNVTLNGASMAPPSVSGRSGRAMPFDVIATSQISQIEVIKSVTPDMDAHALAGTINIQTVSGYDREERYIYGAVEAGQNLMIDEPAYQFDFTYGNVFGEDRQFGLAFAASYSDRSYSNDQIEGEWDTFDGQHYLQRFTAFTSRGDRKRLGLNLNLEFRPDDVSEFYVRTLYNKFDESREEYQMAWDGRSDPVFTGPRQITFNRIRLEGPGHLKQEIEQTLANISAGGSKKFGNLTVEADLTYSYSKEDVPFSNTVQFRSGNIDLTDSTLLEFDFTEFQPAYDDKGVALAVFEDLPLRRFRLEDSLAEEETWTPRVDFKWDFDNLFDGRSGFFKVGSKYTNRSRFVDDNSLRPVSEDLTVSDFNATTPGISLYDDTYRLPATVDLDRSLVFFNQNPDLFTTDVGESASNSVEDDFDVTEKIIALYAMASVDLNPRLTILGGVRYEHTSATLKANEVREVDGDFVGIFPTSGDFDYDNILPNLQILYRLTEQSQLRFAFTGTIGRPAYQDASPISTLEIDGVSDPTDPNFANEGVLETGNPNLDPFESKNLDLSYEYYLTSGGLLSVGLFYKNIDNPIFSFEETQTDVVFDGIGFETLEISETRNAASGTVSGVELDVMLPMVTFSGLKGTFMDGFGINANATFISSDVTVFGREDEDLPFFRQPDNIFNFALYYQKYGLTARVAYNYQSESLFEIGGGSSSDIYSADRQVYDAQVSYRLNENYEIYVNWQNITNEPSDQFIGNDSQLHRPNIFGSNVRAGLRFNF